MGEFQVGDLGYIKLHPFRRNSINNSSLFKLAAEHYGPYKVFMTVGKVVYKLELPTEFSIYPVFYVFLLKQHKGSLSQPILTYLPQIIRANSLWDLKILARKVVNRGNLLLSQVLIQ